MATLDVKNVVIDNPRVLDFLGIDASPIYTTIDASLSVGAGSFSDGDYDYVVSADSHTFPQLVREPSFDVTTGIFYENEEINVYGSKSYFDGLDDLIFGSNAGKFIAMTRPLDDRLVGFSQPFSPPAFYTPNAQGILTHSFDDIVEITDTAGTPPTNVRLRDVTAAIGTPIFTGQLLDGDLKMVINFNAAIEDWFSGNVVELTDTVEISCAAWGSPDFRDIRGTYGTTSYDSKGIEYVWSVTIG